VLSERRLSDPLYLWRDLESQALTVSSLVHSLGGRSVFDDKPTQQSLF
jgi:hypothetical protein